jgi:branched-chain amino acid transport system substrate-binding protein
MRGWKIIVTGLAMLALALTACSSSGSSSGTTAKGSASGADITVAVLCSCSGPFGQYLTPGPQVAQAWANSVNASGGVDGHQVKLVNYDDGGDAGKALTEAKAAVAAKADVILDLSPLDSAWAKTADTAKIPVVGGELNSDLYSTDPNFYPSGQTPDSNGYSLVQTAKDAGAKTIGELYCVEAASCADLVSPMPRIGQSLGVASVYKATVSATAPNYTAQCVAAKGAGAQSIAVADVSSVIIKIGTDCDQQGYDPVYVTAGTGYSSALAQAPGVKVSLWSAYPDLPYFSTAAPVKQMQQTVQKYYSGLQGGTAWSQFAVQAWTGMLLIQAAVKAAGSGDITATSVTTGLNSLTSETLGGWSPPLTFTAGQPHKVDCWFTAAVKNGTPAVAKNGQDTCETAS